MTEMHEGAIGPAFNVFEVLDDAVCENSWSYILGFLFTSSRGHGLDMRPLRTWLLAIRNRRVAALARHAASSSAECEWGTMEGRRLDILIKLLDRRGCLLGVLGVENKLWTGEQPDQISEYQAALCEAFPQVPKALLFLTPDGHQPLTGSVNRSCACIRCSYQTLLTMCHTLVPSAPDGVSLLLSSLNSYIERNILATSRMKSKTEEIVRRLYLDKDHRTVLESIFEYRPTLETVRSDMERALDRTFLSQDKQRIRCKWSQYPSRAANPREIIVRPQVLETSAYSIQYMLRSRAQRPFIGDSFTVLILAWCGNSAAARKRVRKLPLHLPNRLTHNFGNWSGWEVIWEGDTYELQDLGKRDARNLSRLLAHTMTRTFRKLRTAVSRA